MTSVLIHIVDDDIEAGEEFRNLLNQLGDIVLYTVPEEFLKSVGTKRLCIIDYRFNNSGLTGIDVAEKVMEENQRCKVIIVTGMPGNNDLLKLINLKAFKYLNKNDNDFKTQLIKYVQQAIKIVKEDIRIEQLVSKRLSNE